MSPKLNAFLQLMRFDKPVGTILLLWPTWWALWLAGHGAPELKYIVIFTLGVIVMRAAGCVINDIWDRDLDGRVERTKERPLARGALSVKEALLCLGTLLVTALVLVLFLDFQTICLSVVGLFLGILYPVMKRFTHWPQVVLGFAFNWGIVMAFSAIRGTVPAEAWLLYTVGCLWTIGYDTVYAMVDRQDDLKIGIKSTAIILKELDVPFVASIYALVVLGLYLLGLRLELGFLYYVGLTLPLGVLIYQLFLIKTRQEDDCFYAFKLNQVVGLLVFLAIFIGY